MVRRLRQGGRVAVQLGLEEPHDRFGHGVVVAVADGADGRGGADVVEPLGIGNRGVLRSRVGVAR